MKKIYVSMLAFGVVFGASAQVAQQSAQLIKTTAHSQNTVALEQPVFTPSVAAAGDTINSLYYDFSTPANWTFGNEGGTSGSWVVGTTVPSGSFAIDGILSTTAANGFALYDSDLICGASDNAFIQLANPVDMTGQGSVVVTFQENYRKFNDVTYVDVSVDGTNWTSYEVNGAVAGNDGTANPEVVQVNISAVAANQAQVWIRFRFMGACDYSWQIDDVAFVEGAESDLEMTDVWHGDIINAFEYQQIPMAQVQEVVIGATCKNNGGVAQTAATYTFDISDGSSSVASGTFAANNTSIASSASDTTWFATGFTPSATGTYTVSISVASDQTDQVPANNDGESSFKISNNIYTHDDEDNIEFQANGGDNSGGAANEYKMAVYYEVFADATLTSVQVAFGGLTTTSSCIVEIFDAVNDQSLSDPIVTEVYDIQPGDVPTGGAINLVDILINDGDGVELLAQDGLYLISIGNTGEGEDLYILSSDGDDDFGQLRYGPFGAGGAIAWYTGYTTSPMIRGNFDVSIGIEENQDLSGVQVYPNPTSDNINVRFVSKENQNITINIIGANGALIQSEQRVAKVGQSNTVTFNTENLATGIYMIQLVGANSSLTQRVVVQ